MDDAFVNLEDISDEQTLERLESLFETTNNFPTLDSPNFSDEHVITPSSSGFGGFGNASSSLGLSLDAASTNDQDLFGSLVSLPPAPPSQTSGDTGAASSQAGLPAAVTSAPSLTAAKPAKVTKSTAAFKTVISSPQSHTVRTVTTPLSSPQGVILTSSTAPSAAATGVIQQGTQQVLQFQLQPLSGVVTTAGGATFSLASPLATSSIVTLQSGKTSGNGKQQPHLLPKPSVTKPKPTTVSSAPTVITVSSTAAGGVSFSTPITVTAQPQPLVINQGNVLTAGATPLLINSFGQVMGQATAASSPIVIQQSGGSPFIVLRQSAATSTLLPIVTQSATGTQQTGTIFLQQPAAATGVITAQPQVKIITPQGRMQMQQIQTPMGPKLIAVPMGQAGTATIIPQLTTLSTGQCQLLASPHGLVASMPTSVVTTLAPTATISSSIAASTPVVSTSVAAPSQLQQTTSLGLTSSPSDSSGKNKKKKKAKVADGLYSDDKKQAKGLDLGELIKDVGLDLEGFGVDETQNDGILQSSDLTSSVVSMLSPDASGSQLVAQIQQPLPFQPSTSGQFQLVQGPDGQFVLQPAPTLYAHLSDGSGSATLSASGTTTILASPQLVMTAPTATGSVVASASVPTSMTVTVAPPSALSPSKPLLAAANARVCQETGRTPLFEDDRLPVGWRRKVSQRKSGASAGRYEVFIIGPGGKRFRSRNELKAYFEKTGEKTLDPEDFDFSTFGTGRSSSNRNEDNNAFGFASPVPAMAAGVSATLVVPTSLQLGQSALAESAPKSTDVMHTLTTDLLQSDISMEEVEHSQVPSLNSQLSRETADADAQISRLLETLQKNSSYWPVDKDIVKSLRECEESVASTSPTSPSVSPAATTSAVFTSGTSGFQASFLSSLAGKTTDDLAAKKPQSPGLATAAHPASAAQSAPGVAGGATTSQMRALNNLPPNTRLIKGPNGQYTLQKVQTIELSPEMQQSLRAVQARIQEIEKQAAKTPQAEAELAQLQTRQQQILATGRPVATPPTALTQPIVLQQPQTSLSTATVVVASNQQSNFLTNTQSKPTAEIKTAAIRYTHNVGNQVISVAPGAVGAQLPKPFQPNMPPLTDQQKRIVNEFKQKMAQLTPDQHSQFIAQNKAQLIRQLNLQPSQLQALRSSQAQGAPILALDADQQPMAAMRTAILPTVVAAPQVISATTPNITRIFPVGVADGAATILDGTALKRHATEPLALDGAAAGTGFKHKKVAWVESQIKKDQNEAVNPNYKAPFRSKEDACKRLLRYHVFDELDTSPEEIEKVDENFELKSSLLLSKYKTMLSKYHFLLLQESMRQVASSEEVMLARLWDSDERQALIREREEFKAGKLCELPPLPDSWALKYKELCGADPPQGIHVDPQEKAETPLPPEIILDQAHEASNVIYGDSAQPALCEKPESDSHPLHMQQKQSVMHPEIIPDPFQEEKSGFVGVKFSRSVSGNWVSRREEAARQRQREYDEHQAIKNELSGFSAPESIPPEPSSIASTSRGVAHKVTFEQDDDSDQEFSLKDIDTAQAVGSILEGGDSHDEDEGDFDLHFDRYDTPMMEAGEADESVQSAINSILDLPQGTRIETPDLNNITGLLDSMDECDQVQNDQERDPVTEAAVNSIPQF